MVFTFFASNSPPKREGPWAGEKQGSKECVVWRFSVESSKLGSVISKPSRVAMNERELCSQAGIP